MIRNKFKHRKIYRSTDKNPISQKKMKKFFRWYDKNENYFREQMVGDIIRNFSFGGTFKIKIESGKIEDYKISASKGKELTADMFASEEETIKWYKNILKSKKQ